MMLDLDLPPAYVVKGGVPLSQTAEELVSDMVEITLYDDSTLAVGWVPEHDPDGSYQVVVYQDRWEYKIETTLYTRSQAELVEMIKTRVSSGFWRAYYRETMDQWSERAMRNHHP